MIVGHDDRITACGGNIAALLGLPLAGVGLALQVAAPRSIPDHSPPHAIFFGFGEPSSAKLFLSLVRPGSSSYAPIIISVGVRDIRDGVSSPMSLPAEEEACRIFSRRPTAACVDFGLRASTGSLSYARLAAGIFGWPSCCSARCLFMAAGITPQHSRPRAPQSAGLIAPSSSRAPAVLCPASSFCRRFYSLTGAPLQRVTLRPMVPARLRNLNAPFEERSLIIRLTLVHDGVVSLDSASAVSTRAKEIAKREAALIEPVQRGSDVEVLTVFT